MSQPTIVVGSYSTTALNPVRAEQFHVDERDAMSLMIEASERQRTLGIAEQLVQRLPPANSLSQLGMRGVSGILVFLSTLRPHLMSGAVEDTAESYLARLGELLGGNMPIALFSGLSGAALAAWAHDESTGQFVHARYDEVFSVLSRVLRENPPSLNFDHISGVVGVGAYCHAARALPGASEALELALDTLQARSVGCDEGCFWETPVFSLPVERSGETTPLRNLGLAHGSPGVIALLAAAGRDGMLSERHHRLLADACSWLLRRLMRSQDGRTVVGYWDDTPQESRAAWCYGAPGVGYALALAGSTLKDESIVATADSLLSECVTGRSMSAMGLTEPTICHGYAGVAHMLRRSASLLKRERQSGEHLLENARGLYRSALDELEHAVFTQPPIDRPFNNTHWFDFLEGVTGSVMALLEADTDRKRPWESLLLTQ